MLAWEREIGVDYSVQQWEGSFRLTQASTRSTNLREMQQKTTLRWYLTPYRISKMFPRASPLCWRLCGEKSTLGHVLWSCSKLRPLWTQVERLMTAVTPTSNVLSPGMTILSIDLYNVPPLYRTIISHIILATRLTILRHWKSTSVPMITEVIHTVHTHGTYEVLHSSAIGDYEEMSQQWSPWLVWYRGGAIL